MSDHLETLEKLHTRLVDSRDGYERSAELVDSPRLQRVFQALHQLREQQARDLREYLTQEGITLDDDGSILAAAHRRYLDIKDMLSGSDDAVIEEVVRGERELLDTYNEVIEPMGPQESGYDMITDQYRKLEAQLTELAHGGRRAA